MPKGLFQEKESRHIFNVLIGMIVGGSLCLMFLLGINFENRGGFEGKTLWDWLDVVLVPSILIGCMVVVYWYARKTQEQRAKVDHGIALDNQREVLMNSYIELITRLFLEEESDLEQNKKRGNSDDIVRAHTLTLFRRLDGVRKGIVLRFLFDAELLFKDESVIDLRDADLREIYLKGADLRGMNLSGTQMGCAELEGVKLSGAILCDTDLHRANLRDAELIECDLRRTRLSEANLRRAILTRANLKMAELDRSDLSEASLEGADLQGAKLCSSRLRGAYLMDVIMQRVILLGADLSGAYLNGADLSESDLTEAKFTNAVLNRSILVGSNIAEHQLASARSLEGALLSKGEK
jgi:uncharacterized protein YjbI with pentapeptide repeats